MKAVSLSPVGTRSDGKQIVNALIVADEAPASLPTTGADIGGMTEDQVFAPFSVLYVIGAADSKVYLANESGVFVPQ